MAFRTLRRRNRTLKIIHHSVPLTPQYEFAYNSRSIDALTRCTSSAIRAAGVACYLCAGRRLITRFNAPVKPLRQQDAENSFWQGYQLYKVINCNGAETWYPDGLMRLAQFIVAHTEFILAEWDAFAQTILPAAKMDSLALRDHAADILLATVRDMESVQSAAQRSDKSRGYCSGSIESTRLNGASEEHAIGRLGSGFNLMQLVSEYRALRTSVLALWRATLPQADVHDVDDLNLFHESIDQSLAKAVSSYTKRIDESRDMFLAILSHDLRNPLNSIGASAELIPKVSKHDPETTEFASKISTGVAVMTRMISDLLDYTRTRLGAGMPVERAAMDLGILCSEVVAEFESSNPDVTFTLASSGDLTGEWDCARLRQVISNLLGNAIQHGNRSAPNALTLKGEDAQVVVAIRNQGTPIPPGELTKIFDPLVRGASAQEQKKNRPGSIGLGLYIARELIQAHGGTIGVTSSAQEGTVFKFRLPRHVHGRLPETRPGASLRPA
jgi:signal transduction histidine kinase